jgi:hypothetical protein
MVATEGRYVATEGAIGIFAVMLFAMGMMR